MSSKTAFAEKFEQRGISRVAIKMQIAISEFQNNGGTYNALIAMVDAAYGMGSDGQGSNAGKAVLGLPSSPHTHAAKGHGNDADKANPRLPDAAPYGTEEGQANRADKAWDFMPTSVSTESSEGGQGAHADEASRGLPPSAAHNAERHLYVRSPDSDLERGDKGRFESTRPKPVLVHKSLTPADLRAMADTKKQAAVTIMETLKIDGRSIGDWTIGEALRVGRDKLCNGHILVAVARHYSNADHNAKVRDLIKLGDLQRIIQQAAEAVDAV